MIPRSALAALAVVLAGTGSLDGQDTFGETVEIHLVTVEVSVHPYLGEDPIVDLTAEDFEVREDGERRTISHFERVREGWVELSSAGEATPVGSNLAPAGSQPLDGPMRDQYMVLAFDFWTLSPVRLDQTVRRATEIVRRERDPSVQWAVVVLGNAPRVMLPFTSDGEKVAASLDSLSGLQVGVPVGGWGAGTFGLDTPPPPEKGLATEVERAEALQSVEGLARGLEDREIFYRSRRLLRSLEELFRGWGSLDGSRSLLLYYERGQTLSNRKASLSDVHRLHEDTERVARAAAAAGFTVHVADVRGLENPHFKGLQRDGLPRGGPPNLVHDWLAQESGGRYLALNDLSRVVELASARARNHYRISFQVSRPADGLEHELEVKVKRPGMFRVRHPESYLDLSPRDRVLRQLQTSANIPKTSEGLPMAFRVDVESTEDPVLPVRATAGVATDRLGYLWGGEEQAGEVEFFLAVYDPAGQLISLDSEVRSVSGRDPGPVLQTFEAELPAGEYTVAMAALDRVDGAVGMAFTRIHR